MTSPPTPDRLGHQLAMSLRGAYAHLRRNSNRVFSSFGMTSDQYVLLTVLAERGEATQQELVRHCYSDTATMGTMVSLLETRGLLVRTPHPADGRAWSVRLTPGGQDLARRMWRRSAPLRVKVVRLLGEKDLRALTRLLERLAGALQPPARGAVQAARRKRLRGAHPDMVRTPPRKPIIRNPPEPP